MMKKADYSVDVLVVGGGAAGSRVAYEAKKPTRSWTSYSWWQSLRHGWQHESDASESLGSMPVQLYGGG